MANYQDSFKTNGDDLYEEFLSDGSSGVNLFTVGWGGYASPPNSVKGGVRVANVVLPANASVVSATLRLVASGREGAEQIKFIVKGVKESNTNSFAGPSSPFGRTQTTASVTGTYDSSGLVTTLIDVKSIVEEITTVGGWASGNHMAFTIDDNGTTHSSGNQMVSSTVFVLSILVSANPSFTPTTNPVRVSSFPPKQNYGILASHVGFDVKDTNQQHQEFNSRSRVFKLQKTEQRGFGTPFTAMISHGLKYLPAFLSYFYKDGKTYLAPRKSTLSSDPMGNGAVNVAVTSDYIQFFTTGIFEIADLGVTSWTYYVFIDENL